MNHSIATSNRWQSIALAGALALLACMGAHAQQQPSPYTQADDTWIVLSGKVRTVSANSFALDYEGKGSVIVEMDDGDRDADAYKLLPGDRVTVAGRVDDDFFETTTIEASSVYVESLGTTFLASSVDEEDPATVVGSISPALEAPYAVVIGTVTAVDDDEIVIDSAARELRVEFDELGYDPLDDEGYQKIGVGDRIRVSGRIDDDLFEGREIVADAVTTYRYGDR
ncbi:MAG TPA: hypothetical protein VLT59_09900 [Steroidobacteraceae bacterium]|nr:hypothetical protein [Steroidobacteraceae bacterium]